MVRTLLLAAGLLAPLAAAPLQDAAADPTDDELRTAWRALEPSDREEVAAWFTAEAGRMDTFQAGLMRHVYRSLETDRYAWPEAPERPPTYDPETHAPAQPIPRRFLDPDSRSVRAWTEEVFARNPPRRLASGWRYDYGARTVQRLAPIEDPERIFENGLAGFPPDLDLVEALVEQALDDGSQQAAHAAFGHAYADRDGRAYPGVTLYDALGSGLEIEMPDVECLGVVHDLLDDWDTWVAPVSPFQHDELYERIGALWLPASRHRELRRALARVYLSGDPALDGAWSLSLERLHAYWERASSDPAKLAAELPDTEEWEDWLREEGRAVDRDRKLRAAADVRRRTLAGDAVRVRATLVWVMREYGALD